MRRGSIIPDFVKLQIQGQNVGNMVASRSKTSKQNLTVVVTAAVSVETISVGPVSESVAMSISSVVSAMISASIPQAVAIPGLTFVMVMDWLMVMYRLMMVDRVVVVDDGFMMMICLRIVCLVLLMMAVSPAKEKITKKPQKPGISVTILDPCNF